MQNSKYHEIPRGMCALCGVDEAICSWGACWRSDRVGTIKWAAVFILGALVLFAETTNLAAGLRWWNGWSVFFAGAGVIVLLEAGVRLFLPEHRRAPACNLICGFILLAVGLGGQVGWIWALVLIAIAAVILRGGFACRR